MKEPVIVKSLLEAVYQYDRMWPSTRKILYFLVGVHGWKEKEAFPSHAYIAHKTKLGTTQVKKAIKQAKSLGVLQAARKQGEKRRSLTYTINSFFSDAIILINACRFAYNWKKHREEVMQKVAEDEFFFAGLLNKRGQLSTGKVTSSYLCRVTTILALLSSGSSVRRNRVEEPPAGREQANQQKGNPTPIQAGSPYLWGLKIKERDLKTLTFFNSPQELKKAREVLDFLRYKKDVLITNPAGFIISQVKKQRKIHI